METENKVIEKEDSIAALGLSVKSYNCLKRAHILTISELLAFDAKDLSRIRNLGKKEALEILEKVEAWKNK